MEVDELYLDLLSLRELYILLLKSCLRDANSQLLDERAQILLKRLLDDATAEVVQFHSKTKPLEEKVAEWMEHKESRRKMRNVAANDLSNGIALALRRIEFQILSLRRCTSQSRNTRSHINGAKVANSPLNQQKLKSRTDHSTLKARVTEPINGHFSKFVHGFRVPLSQDNVEALKPPIFETQVSKQKKVINPVVLIDKPRCSEATVRSMDQTRIHERGWNSPGRMIMRPTLLNHMNTHMATQQESEFTNSESEESVSSSSWSTQQTSESETTDYPSASSHQEGESGIGSAASTRYRSSSISSKAFRFSHRKKGATKAIGRFKRLRNKLGLIFHHHHHHHHHHHNSHNNNFMWKQLRRIFHGTDKKIVTSKGGHETLKKTAVRSVSRKNQVGKFQALAEGLRSHVWKSKAMKKKGLRKPSLGKKGVKKLHWWRMFRRQRGVKLPKKGRVKIGYVNRKPQLKIV